jgi:hypothetical protein
MFDLSQRFTLDLLQRSKQFLSIDRHLFELRNRIGRAVSLQVFGFLQTIHQVSYGYPACPPKLMRVPV